MKRSRKLSPSLGSNQFDPLAPPRQHTNYVRPVTLEPVYDVVPDRTRKTMGWDAYFLNIAEAVRLRSTCIRRQVGAVIVSDRRIISTGYNGTPKGILNCNEGGCPRCNSDAPSGTHLEDCICVHAEANAIAQAARFGMRTDEAELYCTLFPCKDCAKLMINAGIVRVVVGCDDYNKKVMEQAMNLLADADVELQLGPEKPPMVFGPGPGKGAAGRGYLKSPKRYG